MDSEFSSLATTTLKRGSTRRKCIWAFGLGLEGSREVNNFPQDPIPTYFTPWTHSLLSFSSDSRSRLIIYVFLYHWNDFQCFMKKLYWRIKKIYKCSLSNLAISITSLKNSARNSKIFWVDIHLFNFTTWWARVFCLFVSFLCFGIGFYL